MGAYFTKTGSNYYLRLTGTTNKVKFACVSSAGNTYNLNIRTSGGLLVTTVAKISSNGATFYTPSANPIPSSGTLTSDSSIFSGAETEIIFPGTGEYSLSFTAGPTPGSAFYLGGESLNWGTGLYAYPGSGSSTQAKGIGVKINEVGVGATWKNSQTLWIKRYAPSLGTSTYSGLTTAEKNSLTTSTFPNDDGFWELNVPWNINYLDNIFQKIYVHTNSYVAFDGGSPIYSGFSYSNPNLYKIFITTRDNSCQKLYYGVLGTSPNRRYAVRFEGSKNIISPPNVAPAGTEIVWEMVFYEQNPGYVTLFNEKNSLVNTATTYVNGICDRFALAGQFTITTPSTITMNFTEQWSECETAWLKTASGWQKFYQNNTNSSWINLLELTDDAIDFAVKVIALN